MKEKIIDFTKRHAEIWKFIKFTFTGASTSVLELGVFMLLQYVVFKSLNQTPVTDNPVLNFLGIEYKGYMYSYCISAIIGYAAAYIMNRKLTFKANANPVFSSILYGVMVAATIAFNTWFGSFLGTKLKNNGLDSAAVEMITKVVVMTIPTIWSYPINRFIIHRRKKDTNSITNNNMNQKLIAVDLDGTLLDGESRVSDENMQAITDLAGKGVMTAILTGRTFYEIPKEIRTCKDIEYFVFSDGAGIRHKEKGIIRYHSIAGEAAIRIFDILRSYTCLVEVYANGHPCISKENLNTAVLKDYCVDSAFIPVMLQTRLPFENVGMLLYDDSYKIEMFNVFFKDEVQRMECANRLKKEFYGIEVTSSMSNNLEILNKGVNKGYGLAELCGIIGVDTDDVTVIGDSKNDIPAFSVAKMKYAVSNAHDDLKRLADKIICSNDENIMVYMERELV